jgi:GntR family transcriptional regulator, transcriptional repressor for pyruvate dehydrogenase complex
VTSVNTSYRAQLHQPRLAEVVASDLRERIVTGVLPDRSMLPKQQQLLDEFLVSPPVIREALRILENEGLVTVLRGSVGGAIVHRPQATNVTYTLALVLRSKNVALWDVSEALGRLESACAEACANRPDRDVAVLPRLRATLDRAAAVIDDPNEYTAAARQFHADIADTCGNETMSLMVGALEALWTAHVDSFARETARFGAFKDVNLRKNLMAEHERIYRVIARGDGRGAAKAIKDHLTVPGDDHRTGYEFDVNSTVEAVVVRNT